MALNVEAANITLSDLLERCVDGVFVIDRERCFVMYSTACERITGYSSASVVGVRCPCHDVAECADQHGRSLAGALCPGLQVFQGEIPSARQRMRIRHRAGHVVWVETSYSPILDDEGDITAVVGIMRDITEVMEQEDELREAVKRSSQSLQEIDVAPLDNLTGNQPQVGGQLSDAEAGNGSLDQILTTIERREILGALRRANGQRTLAARLLGISRSRLYRRMEALGIDPRTAGSGDVP